MTKLRRLLKALKAFLLHDTSELHRARREFHEALIEHTRIQAMINRE